MAARPAGRMGGHVGPRAKRWRGGLRGSGISGASRDDQPEGEKEDGAVRARRRSIVAVVAGFAGSLFLLAPGAAQVKPTPDFAFTRGKDSPGAVTFSHEKHLASNTCSACHVKVFKMKKGTSGDITMAKIKEGQFCGACHNGEIAWAIENCNLCHSAPPGTPTMVHESTLQKLGK